jgi:hypothetical protein
VKAYVATTGAMFALLVVLHVWRMVVEPHLATDLPYLLITAAAAVFGAWAWRVFRLIPR